MQLESEELIIKQILDEYQTKDVKLLLRGNKDFAPGRIFFSPFILKMPTLEVEIFWDLLLNK